MSSSWSTRSEMGFLNDSDEETEEEQTILTYALSGNI